MKCPRCQHDNPPQSSFCLECGERLTLTCGSCGAELPLGSRFCNNCGTPVQSLATSQSRFAAPDVYTPKNLAQKILTSKEALEGERKQVTVLFADLKGSMELLHERSPLWYNYWHRSPLPNTNRSTNLLCLSPWKQNYESCL